jgi:hypothetical protein
MYKSWLTPLINLVVAVSTSRSSVLVGVLNQRVVDVGEVRITRTNLGKNRPGKRYLIYLPLNRNYLWEVLHERNVKVRVFIEIPSEGLNRGGSGEEKEAG